MILKQTTLTFHGLIFGEDSSLGGRLGLRFGGNIYGKRLSFFFGGEGCGGRKGVIQYFTV